MSNTLGVAGEYVILSQKDPYVRVQKFTGFVECLSDSGTGTILRKEFRYSFDGQTYSEFQDLNNANLEAVSPGKETWFQFRYVLLTGGPVTITSVKLTATLVAEDPYEGYVAPDPADESRVSAVPVIFKSNFTWNPYNLNRAVRIYKDLNLMVNNMFGHEVWYYKHNPQIRSKDVFLMEYGLYENEPKQCIKVVVPNNQFPDNKLNMGPFGVDWDLPFEVHIDKDYFQAVFGDGTGPQKRDVLYFPRTQRIYQVSSTTLWRDFMYVPLYFKANLVKWEKSYDTKMSEDLQDLESFTVGYDKLFGEEKKQETEKITDPKQTNAAYQDADPVREFLDREEEITAEKLLNYYTVVAEYFYAMDKAAYPRTVSVKLDFELEKGKSYYLRPWSGATAPVLPDIQSFYSQKIAVSKGVDDGKTVIELLPGGSQTENLTNPANVFGPSTILYVYENEFGGATGATETPIGSCETSAPAEYYRQKFVRYIAQSTFPSKEDRCYSAWFRLKKNVGTVANVTVLSFDQYTGEAQITLDRNLELLVGDEISIRRNSGGNFVVLGKVTKVVDYRNFTISIEENLVNFLQSATPTWPAYSDMQVQRTWSRVIFDGMGFGTTGVKIALFENRHIFVTLNDKKYTFSFPVSDAGLADDVWYAIVVNVSNTFGQLTTNVWKTQWNPETGLPATTELKLILNKTTGIDKVDRNSAVKYSIPNSKSNLTNLRIFNRSMETDKQTLVLNQNIVKDAQWSIIIDNALPQVRLPHIGYTR